MGQGVIREVRWRLPTYNYNNAFIVADALMNASL